VCIVSAPSGVSLAVRSSSKHKNALQRFEYTPLEIGMCAVHQKHTDRMWSVFLCPVFCAIKLRNYSVIYAAIFAPRPRAGPGSGGLLGSTYRATVLASAWDGPSGRRLDKLRGVQRLTSV